MIYLTFLKYAAVTDKGFLFSNSLPLIKSKQDKTKGLLIFLKIATFAKKNKFRHNAQPSVTLPCSPALAHFRLGNSSLRMLSHLP